MQAIRMTHDNVDDCSTEMLSHWLQRSTPPPSWTELAEALRSIDRPDISAEIIAKRIPTHPPKITNQPSIVDGMIKLQAQGTQPIRYQWLKDDEELSDGDNYKGSTTSELAILGTGPQVEGNYKCRLINEYGEHISHEIPYSK